jgi:hypothetical protein
LESRLHGEPRACALESPNMCQYGNLHFAPVEKEMKILQRFLKGVENYDLRVARMTTIFLR